MGKGTAILVITLCVLLITAIVMICWVQLNWRKMQPRRRYLLLSALVALAVGLQLVLFCYSVANGRRTLAILSLVSAMLFAFTFVLERRKLRREF